MRRDWSIDTGFLVAVIAILGTVGVRGAECPKDVAPVNGVGILEIQRCVTAVGAEDPRVALLFDQALRRRRDDVVTALLDHGLEPSSPSDVVSLSASHEMPLVLETLLHRDSSLAHGLPGKHSPLALAAVGGSYRAARVLLAYGADPNTGLLPAVQQNHLHIAHLVIEHGAQVETLPSAGAAKLLGAAVGATNYRFVDYLLQRGIRPDLRDAMGSHVLEYAQVHTDELMGEANWRTLIKFGADPQTVACSFGEDRMEALESAAEWYRGAIKHQRKKCPEAPHAEFRDSP